MPLAVAQKAIEEAFSDTEYEEVEISFLGGEPLLAFDRMAEIADWVMAQSWGKPYILFATVNGTLLTDAMKDWFQKRKTSFYLCLSYDGIHRAQDENRSGSSRRIDLEFFHETWPDQPLKMTVSEAAAPFLARNVIDLHERKIDIDASIALGMPRWKAASVQAFREQLDLLADYYLTRPELTPIAFLRHDLRGIWVKRDKSQRYCGAGKQFSTVYIDGSRHPCHLLSPLVLSDERMRAGRALDVWNTAVADLPVCADCILRQFCPMCIGMNFKCTGNPAARDINSCVLVKQQILAACRFQTLLIAKDQKRGETDGEMARAVLTLLRALRQ